jgi:NAD(P)-dependent dehydrogenase (short-subunit alcohol dehydrogenase family)
MSDVLAGRTILITGPASGIGAGYAHMCAVNGAKLLLFDRDPEGLAVKAEELRGLGAEVHEYTGDVSVAADVDRVFDAIAAEHQMDGAFLNAGVNGTTSFRLPAGELQNADREVWDRVIGINLTGFFYTLQRTAGELKKIERGTIVVTSSTSGERAEPLIGYAYIASKTAVTAVSRQAALELSKYGIRINVIAPGSFRTNIAGPLPPPQEKLDLWNRTIPLGRHGQPPELEEVALLLISDRSSFMTGSVVVVDGGATVLTQIAADEL